MFLRQPSGDGGHVAPKGATDLAEFREGDVPTAALDATDIGPVKTCCVGKFFLCPFQRLPPVANPLAEQYEQGIMHIDSVDG